MNEEQYLVDLRKQIQEETEILNRVLDARNSEGKKLNAIKTERLRLNQNLDKFVVQEVSFSFSKIKEAREKRDTFINEREEEIKGLEQLGQDLNIKAKELNERESTLNGKELGIVAAQEAMDEGLTGLESTIKKAELREDIAEENKERWKQSSGLASKLLAKVKVKYAEFVTHSEERSKIIIEKEKILAKEYEITKHKQRLADVVQAEVKKEWIKIDDQWNQLLKAKQHLDGKRS